MIGRVLLLTALLLAPVASAVVNPNPRNDSVDMPNAVTALAMAANSLHIAAGMADPSRDFPAQDDVRVWRAWDSSGNQVREETADSANCNGSLLDNCIGDVVDIALSADGTRIAVAARGADSSSGRLVLATMQGGIVNRQEYASDESPTSLAMSPDGTKLAVGLVRPQANPDVGRVRLYNWAGTGAGTVTQAWSQDTVLAVSSVAISADGRVSAAAGDRHYRFSASGSPFVHDTDATLNVVAFANAGPSHWSMAGAADGGILLYEDGNDVANAFAEFDLQPGSSPQNAVGMLANATLFVAGDNAGVVRLFRNLEILPGATNLVGATAALDGPVADLQLSADGRLLAVAAGRGTYLFRVSTSGISELWRSVGTVAVTDVAVSGDGEHVASAAGAAITVFTAIHSVTAIMPSSGLTASPADPLQVTIGFRNDGNRPEEVTVERSLPADWIGSVTPATFTVQPEATVNVVLEVTPPAGAVPGPADVSVTHRVRGIPTTTDVPIEVDLVRQWTLQAEGALNRDIDAGGSTRFPIRLNNLGNGDDSTTVTATVDLQGWTATVTPSPVSAARGGPAFANVTVTAPASASELQSGKVTVKLGSDPSAGLQLTATIGARFGVTAAADPASSVGTRGEATSFKLRVTNSGNTPDSLQATAGGIPSGWTVQLDASALAGTLQPGASVELPVTVTPPATAEGGNYELAFAVKSLGDPTKATTARHTISLDGGAESESSTSGKGKGSPGLEVPLLMVGLAALAVALRRRP